MDFRIYLLFILPTGFALGNNPSKYNDMRVIRHSQVSPMSSLSFNFWIHPGMSLTGCFVYPSFSPFICPSALTKMPFINHLNMCEGVKRNGRESLRETETETEKNSRPEARDGQRYTCPANQYYGGSLEEGRVAAPQGNDVL